jgi:hypothetical protein
MSHFTIKRGQNLIDALRIANRLGCEIEPIRATGAGRLRHQLMKRTVRFRRRRKDAPRAITSFIRRIAALRAADAD